MSPKPRGNPDEQVTPDQITAFFNGRFEMVPAPEWWEAETDRIFGKDGGSPVSAGIVFGTEYSNMVEIWNAPTGQGRIIGLFADGEADLTLVWTPSLADYLELATTRFGAYLALTKTEPIADTVADIRNTLIAFCRHDQGEHVDRDSEARRRYAGG